MKNEAVGVINTELVWDISKNIDVDLQKIDLQLDRDLDRLIYKNLKWEAVQELNLIFDEELKAELKSIT